MTLRLKKLLQLALSDNEFMKQVDIEEIKEGEYSWKEEALKDEVGRHLVAMCYWGWCIAKNKTDDIRQLLPKKHKTIYQ